MPQFITKLIRSEEIADGTKAFLFEKPLGFEFQAGQYLNWRLMNPPETDEEGTRRFFSIAAAPFEPYLMIATRMRNTAFKRILNNMQTADEIEIFGPSGQIVLHEDSNIPAVFLTGGIGITPFRSIMLQADYEKPPHQIYCFYSNKRPEDTAFFEELVKLDQKNPNIKLIMTMTEMEKSTQSWEGETGYITKELLYKYLNDLSRPLYYIAGPPAMVEAMEKMLIETGIEQEKIKTENFSGY